MAPRPGPIASCPVHARRWPRMSAIPDTRREPARKAWPVRVTVAIHQHSSSGRSRPSSTGAAMSGGDGESVDDWSRRLCWPSSPVRWRRAASSGPPAAPGPKRLPSGKSRRVASGASLVAHRRTVRLDDSLSQHRLDLVAVPGSGRYQWCFELRQARPPSSNRWPDDRTDHGPHPSPCPAESEPSRAAS